MDAAIGRLLAPYRPGGCQGDNQLIDYETCTHFVGRGEEYWGNNHRVVKKFEITVLPYV